MKRVLDFTERAVVGRARGIKLGMSSSKIGLPISGYQRSPRCPTSGYSLEGGLPLSYPPRMIWIGS
jgi:hypothetical protein